MTSTLNLWKKYNRLGEIRSQSFKIDPLVCDFRPARLRLGQWYSLRSIW